MSERHVKRDELQQIGGLLEEVPGVCAARCGGAALVRIAARSSQTSHLALLKSDSQGASA